MTEIDNIPASMAHALQRMADIEARLQEVSGQLDPPPTGAFAALLEQPASTPHDTRQSSPQIAALLAEAAARYRVRPALLRALMHTESGGNPRALSPKGAQGLMQLMPGTAQALGVDDPFDPAQNIMGGAQYLRQQLDRFSGNESLALAAYNAGPGAVLRYHGVPPYAETQRYVSHILSLATQYEQNGEQ